MAADEGPLTLVEDYGTKLKLVLLGDVSVGKTALATRFARGTFGEEYKPTIGASYVSKMKLIQGETVTFQIWDTAGQERYKSLVPMYSRGAAIAVLAYDVTDADSYKSIPEWLTHLRTHVGEIPTALVGNKSDLDPLIDEKVAEKFAKENKLLSFFASAKTGDNVDSVFLALGTMGLEANKRELNHIENYVPALPGNGDTLNIHSDASKQKRCCSA